MPLNCRLTIKKRRIPDKAENRVAGNITAYRVLPNRTIELAYMKAVNGLI